MCKKLILLACFVVVLGLVGAKPAVGALTWESRIASQNDDAEESVTNGGAIDLGSSDLEMPYENAGQDNLQIIGLRFVDVAIPKGAIVTDAYVEFTCDETKDGTLPVSLVIDGQKDPNPGEFTDTVNDISTRPQTEAQVVWVPAEWTTVGQKDQTVNIASVIQEIVNQESWASGNALVLFVRDDPANPSQGTRGAESYSDSANAALLHVTIADEADIRVADGADDAEQHLDDGDMDITSSDLEFPYEDAGNPTTDEQVIGVRFLGIPLDPGAAVVNAYVEIEVDKVDKEGSQAPVNLIIEGELAPDAAAFEDVANNITDRPTTTAKVKWSIPEWTEQDAKFQSPDVSSIIEEIVAQEGWASGNAIVLIFRDDKDNPSTGLREAESFDGEASAAPMLHLAAEFTVIELATEPNPADGAEGVPVGVTLSWTPNSTAVSHDVYFGTANPPELVGNQNVNTYYPGHIEPATTYYWRIDEVEPDGTVLTGDVWSFTTGLGNLVASVRIASGADDVEERPNDNSTLDVTSSDLEFPYEDEGQGDPQIVGMRFVDVGIPKNAEILESYLEFEVDETKGGADPVNVLIDAELSPNAEPFENVAFNVSQRPFTGAVVPWSVPEWTVTDEKFQSPDVTSLVQQILSQDGWAAGNAMVFTIQDDADNPSVGLRCAESYDGEPTAAPLLQITAISEAAAMPHPANGAVDVPLDTTISWWPGFSAVSHDGYIGTTSPPPLLGNTTEVSYDPGGLQPSTTYYWQIDAVAADGTVYPGDIWSFTTVIGEAAQPSPADGALVEQKSVTLSWTAGVTAASHDVYIGESIESVAGGDEGTFVGNQVGTTLSVGVPGAPLPGGLVPGTTYYWRVDEVEADGTTVYKGAVWSFSVAPSTAYNPNPPDGTTGVATDVELSWTPGLDAKLHSVYFGDDFDTVSNAAGAAPMPFTTFNPGPLEPGKTYYWRVDEFNPPTTSKGNVWSFTTAAP
jgi:hypothetical protein